MESFKAMLEDEWYIPGGQDSNSLMDELAYSSSFVSAPETSSVFGLDPSRLQSFMSFVPKKKSLPSTSMSSLLDAGASASSTSNFDGNVGLMGTPSLPPPINFGIGGAMVSGFNPPSLLFNPSGIQLLGSSIPSSTQVGSLSPRLQFAGNDYNGLLVNGGGVDSGLSGLLVRGGHDPRSSSLGSRSKAERGQATLFQKRATARDSSPAPLADEENPNTMALRKSPKGDGVRVQSSNPEEEGEEPLGGEDNLDDESGGGGSGLLYETDDAKPEQAMSGQDGPAAGPGPPADKGKKKGLPAKNLMAERRRRKKLNDRLYMLRSVVPKISKMDRASILGDAIEYLKELLQRINDLHTELEGTSERPLSATALPLPLNLPVPSPFHYPLTPSTPPLIPCRIKEECPPISLPAHSEASDSQPARVEVKTKDGRSLNIHMFCARRPGLLLSTMRALDELGLDVQQAVISCFNGFALDVFRAEQSRGGGDIALEEIKAVLLHTANSHQITM